jgi:hypothetical protein
MQAVENKGRIWGWRGGLVAIALLAALWAVAFVQRDVARGAEGDGCSPNCVILIQVDGLEPKDVTPQNTPYLWLLAHPRVQGQSLLGSAISQRSGFIWQAPRTVASTGTAPATASLLTGAYPEKTGVPADDFYGPNSAGDAFAHQRLSAGGFGDISHPDSGPDHAGPIDSLGIDTLISVISQAGGKAGVFLADPGLAPMLDASSQGDPHWFPPGTEETGSATTPEGQYTGDPRLCPIPRYPDSGAMFPGQEPPDPESAYNPQHCPASDFATIHKAASDLALADNESVGFTFIHLAELGVVKRMAVDADVDGRPEAEGDLPQPPAALANTDEAIGTFVERYAQDNPAKWEKTVLMVVGSHGYQATPLSFRVPDPKATVPLVGDLSDYVASFEQGAAKEGSLRLVPQGTMGTIYHVGDPELRADALREIKEDLESPNGPVKTQCRILRPDPSFSECIRRVSYLDPATPDTTDTVAQNNPTWRLDPRDPKTGQRTRAAGDLLVELERGWATGRAVGLPFQLNLDGKAFTNPYESSSGGPQERAVAALINGPSQGGNPGAVRNLDSMAPAQLGVSQIKYFPVLNHPVDPSDNDNPPTVDDPSTWKCPDTATDPGGLACANDPNEAEKDANVDLPDGHKSPGYEAQPETVDFALTISALMQLPFEAHPDQLQGRPLQEAFLNKLNTVCVGEDCEPPIVEDPPPPEPPPPPPPPVEVKQEPGFNFHGLVRRLRARVVDGKGRAFARAPRGTKMSSIRLEGDFGKPRSAVTLTFYRQLPAGRGKGRGAGRVRLKAMVRFDPFEVKRGEVKITLKVPEVFKPSYVGLTVREIASGAKARSSTTKPCTTLKTRKPVKFRCTGPAAGVIARIVDANRLHKRKVASTRRRR